MRRLAFHSLVGLAFSCLLPGNGLAQSVATERAMRGHPFDEFIAEAAQRFALPAAWLRAVMHAESRGEPRAVSPKGAMGLMQIMPATWTYLRARHRLGRDPFDPHDNIIAGAGYIRELFDRYGSPGWIAAYNAGPGRYEAALRGRPLPTETRAYVAQVAPAIGGNGAAAAPAIAMADRNAWARSPIFVARETVTASAPAGPAEMPVAASSRADDITIAPKGNELFVARTAREDRP